MANRLFRLWSIIGLSFVAGHSWAALREPKEISHSGVKGVPYTQMQSQWRNLAKQSSGLVRVEDYGFSDGGRPLTLLKVGKPANGRKRDVILITGVTHGTEYLGFEDLLPERFLNSAKLRSYGETQGTILFVPIVNPDGYEERIRENRSGVDLNRDWSYSPLRSPGLTQPETRALAAAVKQALAEAGGSLKLSVDYHCCAAALLHPTEFARDNYLRFFKLAIEQLGIPSGTTAEILGYDPEGTSKDYFAQRYGAAALTWEGRPQTERASLTRHLAWWEKSVEALQESPGRIR